MMNSRSLSLSQLLLVVASLAAILQSVDSNPTPLKLRLAKRSGTNDEIIDLVRDILRAKVSRICNEEHNAYEYKTEMLLDKDKGGGSQPFPAAVVVPEDLASVKQPNDVIRILKVKTKPNGLDESPLAAENVTVPPVTEAVNEGEITERSDIDISRYDASVMNLNDFISRFKSKFKQRPQMPFRIGRR